MYCPHGQPTMPFFDYSHYTTKSAGGKLQFGNIFRRSWKYPETGFPGETADFAESIEFSCWQTAGNVV